jgi:hypothetical protein
MKMGSSVCAFASGVSIYGVVVSFRGEQRFIEFIDLAWSIQPI